MRSVQIREKLVRAKNGVVKTGECFRAFHKDQRACQVWLPPPTSLNSTFQDVCRKS